MHISTLPDETLVNIFLRLPQEDLGKVLAVCRRFREVGKDVLSLNLRNSVSVRIEPLESSRLFLQTKALKKEAIKKTARLRVDNVFISKPFIMIVCELNKNYEISVWKENLEKKLSPRSHFSVDGRPKEMIATEKWFLQVVEKKGLWQVTCMEKPGQVTHLFNGYLKNSEQELAPSFPEPRVSLCAHYSSCIFWGPGRLYLFNRGADSKYSTIWLSPNSDPSTSQETQDTPTTADFLAKEDMAQFTSLARAKHLVAIGSSTGHITIIDNAKKRITTFDPEPIKNKWLSNIDLTDDLLVCSTPDSVIIFEQLPLEDSLSVLRTIPTTSLYPKVLKSRIFGCVQSRELSRDPKTDFSALLGINKAWILSNTFLIVEKNETLATWKLDNPDYVDIGIFHRGYTSNGPGRRPPVYFIARSADNPYNRLLLFS